MSVDEFNKLDDETKQYLLHEALELYDIVIKNNVTVEKLKIVAELCTQYGYDKDDLVRLLNPYWKSIK